MDDWPLNLLRLFHFDDCDQLWWRADDGVLSFFVRCDDVFGWGGADLEQVQPDDLPDLERAKRDAPEEEWAVLWVARKRGMRPQGAYYKTTDADIDHLFDAAGPPREVNLINPRSQPDNSDRSVT